MTIAALLISAAVAYCAENPADRYCAAAPVEPAAITETQRTQLAALAEQVRIGSRYRREGNADEWRARGPRETADCEDRLLWAVRELDAMGLGSAARFVAVEQGVDYVGTQRIRRMHLVLVIEGTGERLVLDTQFNTLRAWSDYDQHAAFTPTNGLGGQWESY